MANPVRILIADDHTIVRQGLASLLNDQHDLKVVGQANNGRAAVDKTLELMPDIIIMDIAMPQMNGIEAVKRIKKKVPKTKVLILSMYSHEHYIHELLESGVSGYLLKDSSGRDIIQIADMLCVSISTIKSHRAKIMEKLEIYSPVKLVHFAIQLGLVDPEL